MSSEERTVYCVILRMEYWIKNFFGIKLVMQGDGTYMELLMKRGETSDSVI